VLMRARPYRVSLARFQNAFFDGTRSSDLFDLRGFHDRRFLLAGSVFLSLLALLEDSVARNLIVRVRDRDSLVAVFLFSFFAIYIVAFRHRCILTERSGA
jgi:hypothetical protein